MSISVDGEFTEARSCPVPSVKKYHGPCHYFNSVNWASENFFMVLTPWGLGSVCRTA